MKSQTLPEHLVELARMTLTKPHPVRTVRSVTCASMRDSNPQSTFKPVGRLPAFDRYGCEDSNTSYAIPIRDGAVLFLPSLFRNTLILRQPIKLRTAPERGETI